MLRELFIALSENRRLRSFAENNKIGKKMSRRFVAGETIADLIEATVAVNKLGAHVSVDNLGENVTSREEALQSKALYLQLFDEIEKRNLDANVSVKLTHMGLDVDPQLARESVCEMLARAVQINSFIRVDMEGSPYTQRTIDFTRELHRQPGAAGRIGTVLQSYMHRTEQDAKDLCAEGIRIRLCKGAYREPESIAFQDKKDVDANYVRVAKFLVKSGTYHGLATHDEAIINEIKRWSQQEGVSKNAFEFQMLHGIRRDLQEKLVKEGWQVRVYVPFGTEWYPYYMRRLAERPANVWFILKNLILD